MYQNRFNTTIFKTKKLVSKSLTATILNVQILVRINKVLKTIHYK